MGMTEQESEREPEQRDSGDSSRLAYAPEWWLEEHQKEGQEDIDREGRHRDD
jgi:hypothetical protein